jgi:hypothetical protein
MYLSFTILVIARLNTASKLKVVTASGSQTTHGAVSIQRALSTFIEHLLKDLVSLMLWKLS